MTIRKWRKKPIVIAAVQYLGKIEDIPAEMAASVTRSTENGSCFLKTLEGEMECRVGDFIIKDIAGELYPCKPGIFFGTYEQADAQSDEERQKDISQMLDASLANLTIEKTPVVSLVKTVKPGIIPYGIDKELEDVREFHDKFGILNSQRHPTMLTKRKLIERAECMQEELDEFKLNIESQNFAEQADALIDLVYFAKGTAVMMGLPWEDLWDDVQRANISKVRGMTKRGHAVDVTKPEGWIKPQGAKILIDRGFDESNFTTNGEIDEAKCLDDDINTKGN